MSRVLHIHLQWIGPFTYTEALTFKNKSEDFGIYQIYGSHPVYGSDVLLYIGKAAKQPFGIRLNQEYWNYHNQDSTKIMVYFGRLAGYCESPSTVEQINQISLVERLLIYSHWPAGNSSGLNVSFGKDLYNLHVLNWGQYRDLLPEVSGSRYSTQYESDDGFDIFVRNTVDS